MYVWQYGLADYSMGLAAQHLRDESNATALFGRAAKAWRALWDPSTRGGFLRAKDAAGDFIEPFDEFAWAGGAGEYTEAAGNHACKYDDSRLRVLQRGSIDFTCRMSRGH